MSRVVSVIIPTYNRQDYIVPAIESVLNQDLPSGIDLEVVVVDDGSTDKTEQLLEPYLKRIIYKKIPNSGRPAVPRNIGIELSKGEFIAFQDSDDLWAPKKLLNQLAVFEDRNIGLSFGNVGTIDKNGKPKNEQLPGLLQTLDKNSFEQLIMFNFISTLTVMVRRSVLQAVGNFDESSQLRGVEDYELWLRVAAKHDLGYVNKILAYYRQHDDNISLSLDAAGDAHLYKLFKRICNGNLFSKNQRVVINQRVLELVPHQKFGTIRTLLFTLWLRFKIKSLRSRIK